jgi:uncharacterized protein (DUF1697 family)
VDTFVALLRGINVGTAKRLPMADLRRLLSGLGYTDVATLLNSGNAVFRTRGEPARLAAAISGALATRRKLDVLVVVKRAAELTAIVRGNPFNEVDEPGRLLVAFTQTSQALAALRPIGELAKPPDKFVLGRHAAYLLCPRGSLQSAAGKALLGKPGAAATTRNWLTTCKLRAMTQR